MTFIAPTYSNVIKRLLAVSVSIIVSVMLSQQALAADVAKIYANSCATCHDTGALNAPKKGDKAAWDKVMKKGMPNLVHAVKNGTTPMPAGGLCRECKDKDYENLIDYMRQ